MNIHRIPGLTKHFVYLNDDFQFANKISLNDFFEVKDGVWNTVIYRGHEPTPRHPRNTTYYRRIIFRSNEVLNKTFGEKRRTVNSHIPIIMNVDIMNDLHRKLTELAKNTSSSKFRHEHDIQLGFLYPYFLSESLEKGAPKYPFVKRGYASSMSIGAGYNKEGLKRSLCSLLTKRPKFACINDIKDRNNEAKNAEINGIIKRMYYDIVFPNPSEYELKSVPV